MKLKSLIWTVLFAVLVFFTVVYLGMKYNWVNEAKPKYTSSKNVEQTQQSSNTFTNNINSESAAKTGNGIKPELIDEPPVKTSEQALGSSELTIEDIVTQCQNIAMSVGIPQQQFDQAVLECIDRNSGHLQSEPSEANERTLRIREQCDLAITQKELLSAEEIKMLIDECVASMK